MAEARNAVRISEDIQPTISNEFVGSSMRDDGSIVVKLVIPHPRSLRRYYHKLLTKTRNLIVSLYWPLGPFAALVLGGFVTFITVRADSTSWLRSGWLAEVLWYVDSLFPWTAVFFSLEVRVAYLALMATFVIFGFLMMGQRLLLRLLLSYHGWLYENSRKQSLLTKMWGIALYALTTGIFGPDLLYSQQGALPSLPVPWLKSTVKKYIDSVRPVLGGEKSKEFREQQKLAEKFLANEGPLLQRYVTLKSWYSTNYVTDWWEKYIYLHGRSELLVNSNYYVMSSGFGTPTPHQTSRAAQLTFLMLQFKDMVDKETLPPMKIRKLIPLCNIQYSRMFSTTRIPGIEHDTLVHEDPNSAVALASTSQYIVVLRKGFIYRLKVTNGLGSLLTPIELEKHFDAIKADADYRYKKTRGRKGTDKMETEAELSIPALTTWKRDRWAHTRQKYFSFGINKRNLTIIEKAIMFVVLDDVTNKVDNWNARGKTLFCGNGANRWMDKSISLIVNERGLCGLNTEHSWADAPVVAHCFEWVTLHETLMGYDEKTKRCKPLQDRRIVEARVTRAQLLRDQIHQQHRAKTSNKQSSLKSEEESESKSTMDLGVDETNVTLLKWNMMDGLVKDIQEAYENATRLIDDVDLQIGMHSKFGANQIKKCKCSPDAFVQMALQLAFYRDRQEAEGKMFDSDKFPLTYEASMTRLFTAGRTETIRSVSDLSVNFVKSMTKEKSSFTDTERGSLLRTACLAHNKQSKDAMSGARVDRHLFALYIVSKYLLSIGKLQDRCKFLETALSMKWQLSTSQQPQQQTRLWSKLSKEQLEAQWSPGGGFGPVADNGYGVSYMVVPDRIFFHVSSKKQASNTDSERFLGHIKSALNDLQNLF